MVIKILELRPRITLYLSFTIDCNDTRSDFIVCSDEYGIATDSIHVDASSSFKIVQVDKAVLGNQENDVVLFGDLHGDWEIIDSFWREKDVDGTFLEDLLAVLVVNLDNV